jgi:hypothetical protein
VGNEELLKRSYLSRVLPLALTALLTLTACGGTDHVPGGSPAVPDNTSGAPHSQGTGPGLSFPPGQVWQHLGGFPAETAIGVASVTTTDGGFVAVGSQPWPGEGYYGRRAGVVWRSADGLSWQRETPSALGRATLEHVVSVGSSMFAFGSVSSCPLYDEGDCQDDPDAGNAVWRSTDGGDWEMLPQSQALADASIDGVAATSERLVVFGDSGDELSASLWTSSDGVSWTAASDLTGLDPIDSIGVGPDGMVAFGTDYDPVTDAVSVIAAWSSDGTRFERVNTPGGIDGEIDSVAHGDGRWVAVGSAYPSDSEDVAPLVFTSPDGRNWTDVSAQSGLQGMGFSWVGAVAGGFVGLTYELVGEEGDSERAYSFFSSDGAAWRPRAELGGIDYTDFDAVAAGGPGVVVFVATHQELENDDVSTQIDAWFAPRSAIAP